MSDFLRSGRQHLTQNPWENCWSNWQQTRMRGIEEVSTAAVIQLFLLFYPGWTQNFIVIIIITGCCKIASDLVIFLLWKAYARGKGHKRGFSRVKRLSRGPVMSFDYQTAREWATEKWLLRSKHAKTRLETRLHYIAPLSLSLSVPPRAIQPRSVGTFFLPCRQTSPSSWIFFSACRLRNWQWGDVKDRPAAQISHKKKLVNERRVCKIRQKKVGLNSPNLTGYNWVLTSRMRSILKDSLSQNSRETKSWELDIHQQKFYT